MPSDLSLKRFCQRSILHVFINEARAIAIVAMGNQGEDVAVEIAREKLKLLRECFTMECLIEDTTMDTHLRLLQEYSQHSYSHYYSPT